MIQIRTPNLTTLNNNIQISVEEKVPYNSDFSLFNQSNNVIFNIYNQTDGNIFTVGNEVIGLQASYEDVFYHNESYILEGSTKGANNVDIETDRIIDKEIISNTIIPEFKSKSGKIIHLGDKNNQISRSNYVLKPSDKLVFGVSSNCNGQVMPTVFKLHDKVEITLIGRDYVNKSSHNYKNNQSQVVF